MMHTALMFPGLVPTKHAKAGEFLRNYAPATRMLSTVDEVLGYSLMEKYATADVYDWEVYQSAHLVTVLALAHARTAGNETTARNEMVVCGQSFGGFAAAIHSGSCVLPDVIQLLRRSTTIEQQYFDQQDKELACVFFARLSPGERKEVISEVTSVQGGWLDLSVEQDRDVTAVSGTRTEVEAFARRIRQRKAVVFYVMNRAEHCRRMGPLAELLLRDAYKGMPFKDPDMVLLADNGEHLSTGEQVRTDLARGWARPLIADELYGELINRGVGTIMAPTARGMFTDFGEGRFKVETILPNATARKLKSIILQNDRN